MSDAERFFVQVKLLGKYPYEVIPQETKVYRRGGKTICKFADGTQCQLPLPDMHMSQMHFTLH
jgi:hypothetical protein